MTESIYSPLDQIRPRERELIALLQEAYAARDQRAAELDRARAEIDRFVATAAHDLSTPLRVVAGYAELLRSGELDGEQADFAERIVRAAERMQAMIDGLSRFAETSAELNLLDVDLGGVLDEVLDDARGLLEDRGARVEAGELPVVVADRILLASLLLNLIENAAKFGPDRGVIEVFAERAEHAWRVSVRDHGPGIAAEDQERIFVAFRRLRGTGNLPGSGLGLAIARRIAERHDGELTVRSSPGDGATFTLTLPDRD